MRLKRERKLRLVLPLWLAPLIQGGLLPFCCTKQVDNNSNVNSGALIFLIGRKHAEYTSQPREHAGKYLRKSSGENCQYLALASHKTKLQSNVLIRQLYLPVQSH